jgi:hypothetical protein
MYKKVNKQLNGAVWYTGYMGGNQGKVVREARLYLELIETVEPMRSPSEGRIVVDLCGDEE